MSDENEKKDIKGPFKALFKKLSLPKKIGLSVLAATLCVGAFHQGVYGIDNLEGAVTERMLNEISNEPEVQELTEFGELAATDKVSKLNEMSEIAAKYTDVNKLQEIEDTYIKLVKQTVANTYGIDVSKVGINTEDRTISLEVTDNLKFTLYSQDFIREEISIKEIGMQLYGIVSGHTMSSEFNTVFDNIDKLEELKVKSEKGEITVQDIQKELSTIRKNVEIFREAKGETNKNNIKLKDPESKEPEQEL